MQKAKIKMALVLGVSLAILSGQAVSAESKIDIGERHTIFKQEGSYLWSWGTNSYGELARENDGLKPAPLQFKNGSYAQDVKDAYADEYITVVLTKDGKVFTSGANLNGQLGLGLAEKKSDGSYNKATRLTEVPGLSNIVSISHNNGRTYAVRNDGLVYGFGKNDEGRLGNGQKGDRPSPTLLPGLQGIVTVQAGSEHALALDKSGNVFAWGYSHNNTLGVEKPTLAGATPSKVQNLTGVIQIWAGNGYSLALKGDKTLWTWGDNSNNEVGTGGPGVCHDQTITISSPIPLRESDNEIFKGVEKVKIVNDSTYVFLENQEVWTWDCSHPFIIGGFEDVQDFDVNKGSDLMVTLAEGDIYSAGTNVYGQLGTGDKKTYNTPVLINLSTEQAEIEKKAASHHGNSQWYLANGSPYNATYYASQALRLTPSNTTMITQMDKSSAALSSAAYVAFHAYDDITSERHYKLLHTTPYVPEARKIDAQINIAYVYSGRAKWYYARGGLYNAVHFLSTSVSYGNTNKDVRDLIAKASQELYNGAVAMNGTAKAMSHFHLLKNSVGVPTNIRDAAAQQLNSQQ